MTQPHHIDAGLVQSASDAIRQVAADVVRRRFGSLSPDDIFTKTGGELVTVVDLDAEAQLVASLRELVPSAVIVSEEDTSPTSGFTSLRDARHAWVIDPLDGTANFVNGSEDYAILIALLEAGVTTASWTYLPACDRMYVARRGRGAVCNGEPLRLTAADSGRTRSRAVVKTRFLKADLLAAVAAGPFDVGPGVGCAGVEYCQLVDGEIDLLLYWRTNPWDHAAGSLLVAEAGGVSLRPDGSSYAPHQAAEGLLTARSMSVWRLAEQSFFAAAKGEQG